MLDPSELTTEQMGEILRGYRSKPRPADRPRARLLVGSRGLAGRQDRRGREAPPWSNASARITADIRQYISRGPKIDRLILAWGATASKGSLPRAAD